VLIAGRNLEAVEPLLGAAQRCGFRTAQLWLSQTDDAAEWDQALHALGAHGMVPVALGGYVNPLDPTRERPAVLARLEAAARRAADAGAPTVVTWSGTRAAGMLAGHAANGSRGAWEEAVSFFRAAAGMAERAGVTLAIEPYYKHVASTPQRLRDLLDEVGSTRVRAVMDPPNFVDAATLPAFNDRLPATFEALAGRIALVHAKDIRAPGPDDPQAATGDVLLPAPGEGVMDYARFAALVRSHCPGVDVLVEHVTAQTMAPAVDHVRRHLEPSHHREVGGA
jgi:sugar phosphate isomerase/epimerase